MVLGLPFLPSSSVRFPVLLQGHPVREAGEEEGIAAEAQVKVVDNSPDAHGS